jgi:hypothetical protein
VFELLERPLRGAAGVADLAGRLLEIVPDLVGMSITFAEGLTMTLVAPGSRAASLDALQFLDGGLHDSALSDGDGRRRPARSGDPLDEEQWRVFRAAETRSGVESSLSLPVDGHSVISCVDLYGATPNAFDGRLDAVSAAVGSSPTEAVSNADLSFTTRLRAATSAAQLEEDYDVDLASDIVSGRHGVSPAEALERLRSSAARADVSLQVLARVVIDATVP